MPRPFNVSSPLKLYILAPLAFFVLLFVSDTILFGFVAKDFFASPGMMEMPNMTLQIIGYLLGAILISYTYMWYGNNPNVGVAEGDGRSKPIETTKGWEFGVLMALLIFLPSTIIFNSLFEGWNLTSGLVEVIYRVIQFAIGGIIIAKILK